MKILNQDLKVNKPFYPAKSRQWFDMRLKSVFVARAKSRYKRIIYT